MGKIDEIVDRYAEEINNSVNRYIIYGESDERTTEQTIRQAITEALAERDARIKELEAELSRIKDGAKKLEAVDHYDGSGRIHPAVLISDLDRLMKGGE